VRKGLQTLTYSFEAESLTHFGGLFLIQRFCNRLQLRRRLERILQPTPTWSDYHPADVILVFLYVLIAGLPRVNKTEILQYNGLFLSLIGLPQFPDQTALRRFLRRLSPKAIRQIARLHDQIRAQLFGLPHPRTRLVFHMDSVVLTLYGKQQGARIGYNPRKKGSCGISVGFFMGWGEEVFGPSTAGQRELRLQARCPAGFNSRGEAGLAGARGGRQFGPCKTFNSISRFWGSGNRGGW